MWLGARAVALIRVDRSGPPGYLGVSTEARTMAVVRGCHGRQVAAEEVGGGVAVERWKWTLPACAAGAVDAGGELIDIGTTEADVSAFRRWWDAGRPESLCWRAMQVDGPPAPRRDLTGAVDHVTITTSRRLP